MAGSEPWRFRHYTERTYEQNWIVLREAIAEEKERKRREGRRGRQHTLDPPEPSDADFLTPTPKPPPGRLL